MLYVNGLVVGLVAWHSLILKAYSDFFKVFTELIKIFFIWCIFAAGFDHRYGPWSSCTAECGGGKRFRLRQINGDADRCYEESDEEAEIQDCATSSCSGIIKNLCSEPLICFVYMLSAFA